VLLWANSSFIVSLGIPVMRLLRTAGKPYIVKPFGSMLADRIEALGQARRNSVVSLLNGAVRVLPETGMLAEELAARSGLDPGRLLLFPNMIPDGMIRDRQPAVGFSGRCVFIGQVKEEKGVFDIITALRDREDLSCDFYGQVLERDEKRFFAEIGLSRNCLYRGTLSGDEVTDAVADYDALLLPTFHQGEGYPAVILEAFAAGIPVITTRWKAIPELVEDGKRGILIPPHSPGQITLAIDELSGDEILRRRITGNGLEYVKGFSEGSLVGRTLVPLVMDALMTTEK
jgi:glycosyltransferase involved in cell wall biosynthesis